LSVEPSRRSCGERKKKKETSAVKYNTSGHYRGRRYNYSENNEIFVGGGCFLAAPGRMKSTEICNKTADKHLKSSSLSLSVMLTVMDRNSKNYYKKVMR